MSNSTILKQAAVLLSALGGGQQPAQPVRQSAPSGSRAPRAWQQAKLFVLSFASLLFLHLGSVQARCWEDINVTQRTRELAQQFFPVVAAHMPAVKICSSENFSPNVIGSYTGGLNVIRVLDSQLDSLDSILPHELAHASVYFRFGDRPAAQGHGVEWSG
jgi:hypothetical protein